MIHQLDLLAAAYKSECFYRGSPANRIFYSEEAEEDEDDETGKESAEVVENEETEELGNKYNHTSCYKLQ